MVPNVTENGLHLITRHFKLFVVSVKIGQN